MGVYTSGYSCVEVACWLVLNTPAHRQHQHRNIHMYIRPCKHIKDTNYIVHAMQWAKAKLFYGTNASRTDEHLLTTMSILDNRWQAQHWKTAKVREAILADRRQTIHDVCEIVGLSYGTIQRILADNLNMRRISARFVPRLLSDDQRPFVFLSAGNSNNKPEMTPTSSPIP